MIEPQPLTKDSALSQRKGQCKWCHRLTTNTYCKKCQTARQKLEERANGEYLTEREKFGLCCCDESAEAQQIMQERIRRETQKLHDKWTPTEANRRLVYKPERQYPKCWVKQATSNFRWERRDE